MRIHYNGRNADVSERQKQKLRRKFEKIHKILSPRLSLEARVTLSCQRHLHEAEVTLHVLNHTLVVAAANQEPFTALLAAVDKLEKQAVKNKHKLIDVRRGERQRGEPSRGGDAGGGPAAGGGEQAGAELGSKTARILRSNPIAPKPLTVEEAVLQLDELDRDQITFREAGNGRVHVLLRRRDGDFELIDAG